MLPIAAAARRFLRRQQDYNLIFSWIHFLKASNPLLSNQCFQPVGVFVAVWSEQDAVQLSLTPHHSRSHIEGSENRRPLNASLIRFFPSRSVLLVAGSIDGKLKKKNSSSSPSCRYRVVVPYPPQSEAEIELREGDVVFVHKKRDDGWYKGTLQRTGQTGLFPSSFVESFWTGTGGERENAALESRTHTDRDGPTLVSYN